jgi:prevent-host-death family protein
MRLSTQVKPISYFKANAAELIKDMSETREPMAITQNGAVTAIVQDVKSYEETQETLALLKILALGLKDIEEGRCKPAEEVFDRLKAKYR